MAAHDPTHAGDPRVLWLSRVAWAILVLSVGTFLVRGVNRVKRPVLIPPGGVIPAKVAGFGEVGFKVGGPARPTSLTSRTRCALLATTMAQQQQGLMHRRDLGGYDGMIFRFDSPTTVGFYMKDTLIPLSIAWFNPAGTILTSTTMLPCPANFVTCPTYFANAPYSVAIEVRAGLLPQLGIGPGSTITVGGPC